jgi:AcrR family transcriptional regulator
MEEKELQILQQVNLVFMQYGIKSVTMDDIARELAVSKKTLYQYFTDKNDLVYKAFTQMVCMEKNYSECIMQENENAIDQLIAISNHVIKLLQGIHPSIFFDLQKYYPDAWRVFVDYKKEGLYANVLSNLELGIKQGLYRDNMNPKIIAWLHVSRIELIFGQLANNDSFNNQDVFPELMRYHIRGIASSKGIAYLTEIMQSNKHNIF